MRSWRKIRSVGLFEFECTIRSKSWLIVTFGMPVFLLLYAGVVTIPAVLSAIKEKQVAIYGVVDEAAVLGMRADVAASNAEIPEQIGAMVRLSGQKEALERSLSVSPHIVFRPFTSEAAARGVLMEGKIKGYYRIPADYVETGVVETYTSDRGANLGGGSSRRALSDLLQVGLLRGRLEETLSTRVRKPMAETRAWTVSATGELRKSAGAGRLLKVIVPLAFAILLLVSILMSAGALIQATAIEKENKVVEVILASAKPDEVLMGKLLGLGAAGVIQMGVWFGMMAVAAVAFMQTLAAVGVELPRAGILSAVLFFPLAYLFFGSLMLGTGSLGSTQREANQWGMIWSLPVVVPMILLEVLYREPHGSIARVMTWIPFTAPVTAVFRLTVDPAGVAWWEVLGAVVVLAAATWLAIRLGARLFRVGILLTGARPKLREILRQARLS